MRMSLVLVGKSILLVAVPVLFCFAVVVSFGACVRSGSKHELGATHPSACVVEPSRQFILLEARLGAMHATEHLCCDCRKLD